MLHIANNSLAVIESIIESPLVDQYVIGITKDSIARRQAYKREGFDFYVTIDFSLSADKALKSEEELFKACIQNKQSILYKKYHHKKRDGTYYPSKGGSADSDSYDIYIAYWSPEA